jgi:hypothetical protein
LISTSEGWSSWLFFQVPNGTPLERWAGEWDESLLEALPNRSGLYEWGIQAPDSDLIVPVYIGKAGGEDSSHTLRDRVPRYLRDGSHGGVQRKMHDYLKRGFTFYFRVKVGLSGTGPCAHLAVLAPHCLVSA